MTRENKLALVVGFGLILFVGILVSDHFSAQRFDSAQLAQASNKPAEADSLLIKPLAPLPESLASNQGSQTEGQGTIGPEGTTGPVPPIEPVGDKPGMVVQTASNDDANTSSVAVRFHKVQSGETLWKIAAKEYGDGSLSKELAEYNKSALTNGVRLSLNQELRIPPREVLRPDAANKPALNDADAPKMASAESKQQTYTIAKGDTVYQIARKYKVKPQAIMAANGISDPGALKLGQTIKIPAGSF